MGAGFKNVTDPSVSIEAPGGSFAVRGLSLADVLAIFNELPEDTTKLFAEFTSNGGDAGALLTVPTDPMGIGAAMVNSSPKVVALIIACAAGEFDAAGFGIASRLPAPVQIEALEAVGRLSFAGAGGAKKFLEIVTRILASLTAVVKNPSP